MGRIGLAFRAFFRTLSDPAWAERIERPVELPRPHKGREALTLLSVLQREARLVDFLKEPISGYTDAQVGAAVRDVHRGGAAVIDRLFALAPVDTRAEGSDIEVAAGFDAARIRLTGNVSGTPPFRGKLRHAGWQATRCEVPEWSGSEEAARVVAPAEVEV